MISFKNLMVNNVSSKQTGAESRIFSSRWFRTKAYELTVTSAKQSVVMSERESVTQSVVLSKVHTYSFEKLNQV